MRVCEGEKDIVYMRQKRKRESDFKIDKRESIDERSKVIESERERCANTIGSGEKRDRGEKREGENKLDCERKRERERWNERV